MAISIAFGTTMIPRPWSESIVAVAGVSRTISSLAGGELAFAVPVHVGAEHVRYSVCVHAADVGRDENVGGNLAVRVRHSHLGEYLSDGVSEWGLVDAYRVRLLDLELV